MNLHFSQNKKTCMENKKYTDLTSDEQNLLEAAFIAMNYSYSPYSHFEVGAALLTTNNHIISASNVENAAFGSCICAERSALVSAHAQGHKTFSMMAIIARPEGGTTKGITAPCGSCRQMMFEASQVSEIDMKVIMSDTSKGQIIISAISELLPLGFGPNNLIDS